MGQTPRSSLKPTRRQRQLIRLLRFRAAGEVDPERRVCWVAGTAPHLSLIVPTMMGTWEHQSLVCTKTIADMESAGWIVVGPRTRLPDGLPTAFASSGRAVSLRSTVIL